MAIEIRRDTAHSFFQALERNLQADEFVMDKNSVRLRLERAEAEQRAASRKRFDPDASFRHKVLYDRIDTFLADWCRRREVKADPYKVFRYEGPERGPTQHETAVGPSRPYIERAFDRLAEGVPLLPDSRKLAAKAPTKTIAPAFRLQFPMPFGACGEVKYGGGFDEFARGIYLTALMVATRGDVSRNWTYDCGAFIFYPSERPRAALGDPMWDAWPEVQAQIWQAGRLWPIVL